MMQKPRAEEGMICPWHRKDMSKVCHKCPLWGNMRLLHPQTGEPIDEWRCAMSWMPVIMAENSRQTMQAGAAVESLRNEVVVGRSGVVMSPHAFPPPPFQKKLS